MKKYFILTLTIIFNFVFYNFSFSVPANPEPITVTQPDGTEITIVRRGDEFYNWTEDIDGYTVIKDTQTKFWVYAQKDNSGDLIPSNQFVGKVSPVFEGIKKSLKDENKLFKSQQKRQDFEESLQKTLDLVKKANTELKNSSNVSKSNSQIQNSAATGIKTNFVILIQFKNLKFNQRKPFIGASDSEIIKTFNELFNTTGYKKNGAVGSVRDYFQEISYSKLDYTSVIFPEILEIDEDYEVFGERQDPSKEKTAKMIKAALEAIHGIDNNYFRENVWKDESITEPQGFTVIHAGGGAEAESDGHNSNYIWSHASYLSKLGAGSYTPEPNLTFDRYHIEPAGCGEGGYDGLVKIGVICHESLHFFGLPDLYDTTYMSAGLGAFCVMSAGEWNGNNGNRPAHPCVWAKNELGWITLNEPTEEGTYTIETSAKYSDAFYKFTSSNFDQSEYFLMENRQSYGFDLSLPGTKRGLLIYHIDEKQKPIWNNNYRHYTVDIEEADGTAVWVNDHLARLPYHKGLDSDYFRMDTVSYFTDDCQSSPNSKSYSYQSSGIKISGISASSDVMSFIYGKDVVIIDDLSNIITYPNPARDGYIKITKLPTNINNFSAEVFTLTAKLVKTFSVNDIDLTNDGIRYLKWDCKNNSGEDVAPGVYLVLIKNNSKKKVFKIAIIR